jgi:uncharacterized protein YuzB (UPF0349 family)
VSAVAGVTKVEVCISNLRLGTKLVCDHVCEMFPSIKVNRWACLGHCDRCIKVPYVLIDDHVYIEADDPQTLWIKVKTYIEANMDTNVESNSKQNLNSKRRA